MERHELQTPSEWVCRFAPLIRSAGTVLDLACGAGRHTRYLRGLGWRVVAVDRDAAHLDALDATDTGLERVCADLEGAAWPFAGRSFDGIVVTNYLHRPLFPLLRAALNPEGVFIYETFADGNARYGRPSNPAFLLRPGELLQEAGTLQVVAFEQGVIGSPRAAVIQRICAVRGTEPRPLQP
jgi:SAM-dependent methyltransferase